MLRLALIAAHAMAGISKFQDGLWHAVRFQIIQIIA